MTGIVLQHPHAAFEQQARRAKLKAVVQAGHALPWERTLFVDPGLGQVPWEQVGRGLAFLDTWEAAAPIWNYETLAADVAAGEERAVTEALIGDLRVPLYVHELLFVRDCAGGRALLTAFEEERAGGGDVRLAFLRALYRTKPLFLALPRSWLRVSRAPEQHVSTRRKVGTRPLVKIEIAPGRFVQCYRGDEEKAKTDFAKRAQTRRTRRGGG
jgi:hypothetical protein